MVENAVVDFYGYTHSIDMVTVEYFLNSSLKSATDDLITLLCKFGLDQDREVKLNAAPSFRYAFYTNHIWHDGIRFSLGKWSSYDKKTKKWYQLDMLLLRVNPNKHVGTLLFDAVLDFIKSHCIDGELLRYDYAIDVPVDINDVLVIGSRKEKGLYKGTRYYGQRHHHGYLKVYDKAAEQKLDTLLTRIEYTFKPKDIPSWDNITIRAPVSDGDAPNSLPGAARMYLDMLLEIRALGGQIEPYLERMTYRMYKQIEPYLFSGVQLQFDDTILTCLLDKINTMFIISDTNNKVNDNVQESEFMTCFDTDLPFD